MRLRWDEATERFRDELRAWLDEHAPPEELRQSEPALSAAHYPSWARPWQNLLFAEGLLIPGLGPEYGGRDLGPVEQLIYYEEFTSRQIPRSTNWTGVSIIVPSIIDFGTPEQIERFALPALHAETSWCLGMSEPNAGSDLAGLQTKAVPHGDTFVVNGQKIWTSGAHHADWCLCFVRTDPTAPKHKGISCLLIDMKTPGIEVRPIEEITGGDVHDLNEVFFTDVEVPAANLLGPLHGGWPLTQGSLAHERAILWIENCFFVNDALDHLMGLVRDPRDGRRSEGPRRRRRQVHRRLGAPVHGVPRFRQVRCREGDARALDPEAVLERGLPADVPVRGGDGGSGSARHGRGHRAGRQPALHRQLEPLVAVVVRRHDPWRHERDPTQHRRRTGAGVAAPVTFTGRAGARRTEGVGIGDRPREASEATRERRNWIIGQVVVLAAVYLTYTRLRMLAEGARWLALRNAYDVMSVERRLGIFHEHAVQQVFIHHLTMMKAWNLYYGFVHFLVPLVAVAILLRGDRVRYRRFRNTFWFLCGLGLVGFVLYPLMPPRFMPASFGFVDSMNVIGGPFIKTQSASQVANAYAAMPSLHGGWSLWCACAIVPAVRSWWAKALVCLHPVIQLFAIVVTGNHFWIDAVVGWLCLAVAYGLARGVESWSASRAAARRSAEEAVAIDLRSALDDRAPDDLRLPGLVDREATARSG